MQKKRTRKNVNLEVIKRLSLVAMFSDDVLMETLVLKGGNALDLVLQIGGRSSVDLDFSMSANFPGGAEALRERIQNVLLQTFKEEDYQAFDITLKVQPPKLTADLADFWGGYSVEFKLIETERYMELRSDIEALRRNAIQLGKGTKFIIEISCHEYTASKQATEFSGYQIFIYSPEMILAEKLRAICQQTSEYGHIVKRDRPGAPRARDFFDIWVLLDKYKINVDQDSFREILSAVFDAKRVPLSFIGLIEAYRDFHRINFDAVRDTVKPDFKLKDFDYYFENVLELSKKLEAFWNK